MAPKAKPEEAAQPAIQLPGDDGIDGSGVTLRIACASLACQFEPWSGEGVQPVLPTLQLRVTCLGLAEPATCPAAIGDATTGTYQFDLVANITRGSGLRALDELLNTPPVLSVVDAVSNVVLASVPLDVTGFGLGEHTVVLQQLRLQLAPPPAPPPEPPATTGKSPAPGPAGKRGAAPPPEPPPPPPTPTFKLKGAPCAARTTLQLLSMSGEGTGDGDGDTPFRYVPEEEVGKANVVTLELKGPTPLPAPVLAAALQAGSKLAFCAALVLPSGAGRPLLLVGGVSKPPGTAADAPASMVWANGRVRRVMRAAEMEALMAALDAAEPGEAVVSIEVGRASADEKPPAGIQPVTVDAVHGLAALPAASCLLEGGTPSVPPEAGPAAATSVALLTWPTGRASALPPPPAVTPPAGKGKADAFAADPGTPCMWEGAGSVLGVRLEFARPPLPTWQPPAPPARPLHALIPTRELHPPPPPVTSAEALRQHMQQVVLELAALYKAEGGAKLAASAVDSAAPPEQAFRPLIRTMNKTGKFVALREALKPPLVAYVRDNMGETAATSMAPADLGPAAYGALYTALTDAAHEALNDAARVARAPPAPAGPEAATDEEVAAMLTLATYAEASGDATGLRRAAALLARRRKARPDDPGVHLDAAWFECRQVAAVGGGTEAALACAAAALRAALEIDPADPRALATAAAVHATQLLLAQAWQQGGAVDTQASQVTQAGEAEHLAIAAGHALKEATGGSSLAWVLLLIAYCAAGQAGGAGASCLYELKRRQREARAAGQQQQAPNADAAGLLAAWQFAEELGLGPLAARVADLVTSPASGLAARALLPSEPATAHLARLLAARTHLLAGELQAAEQALKQAKRLADAIDADSSSAAPVGPQAPELARLEKTLLMGDVAWERARGAEQGGRGSSGPEGAVDPWTAARRWYQEALLLLTRPQHPSGAALFAAVDMSDASDTLPLTPYARQGPPMYAPSHARAEAHALRALLRLSDSYLRNARQPQCALDVAAAAISVWPQCGAAWSALARALDELPGGTAGGLTASDAWAQANACDPWDGGAWEALAAAAFQSGRYQDGCSGTQHVLALNKSATSAPASSIALPSSDPAGLLRAAATCCSRAGDYHGALRHLRDAAAEAQRPPLVPGARFQVQLALAATHQAVGDASGAQAALLGAAMAAATPFEHAQLVEARRRQMGRVA